MIPHPHRATSLLQSGFTLIELMISIAVLAILMGVAIPSFTDFLTRSNQRTGSINFQADVKFASEQARIRGGSVIVSTLDGTVNWKDGYHVWVDQNNNNTAEESEVLRQRDSMKAGVKVVTGTTSTGRLRFNRDGTVVKGAHTLTIAAYPATTILADKIIKLLASGMMTASN